MPEVSRNQQQKTNEKSEMNFLLIPLLTFAINAIDALEFPPSVKICKKSDTECANKAFISVIQFFEKGSSEYGVPKLNPFTLKEVRIPGNGGAIDLEQIYHDAKVYGILNIVPDITITQKGTQIKIHVMARVSNLWVQGQYEAKGKMLLFQINGGGSSNLTLSNIEATYDLTTEIVDRDNDKYLKVTGSVLDVTKADLALDYKNLVNGNEQLSKTVLDAMNANSDDVLRYLQKDYEGMLNLAFQGIAEGVLSKIPLKNIFLD